MFRSSKPVFLDSRSRRGRKRVPTWLVLLLGGMAVGVAGVILVQQRYLPPRLSMEDSKRLQADYQAADAERTQLRGQLADVSARLAATETEKTKLATDLGTSKQANDALRKDVVSALAALPSDPRGGPVEVRAATFTNQGGVLNYDVALTRKRVSSDPLTGVMQLVVESAGAAQPFTAQPVAVSLTNFQNLQGSLTLPAGFAPRQVTVKVLDRVGGKQLGMRVKAVK